MRLAVVTSTYYRSDGKTNFFLSRCLNSIKSQTHDDYKVFLIGDRYEKEEEFLDIAKKIISKDKIYFENLSHAKERDKYLKSSEMLWCSGGVNAYNYAIEKAIEDGYEYICHLDHDDYWGPDHLLKISNFLDLNINYVFIATRCNYLKSRIVPVYSAPGDYYPIEGDITHSSTCINFKEIDIKYRDVYEETGKAFPADADLWIRLREKMKRQNLKGALLEDVTVFLDKIEKE
jgi:hypothetical protein